MITKNFSGALQLTDLDDFIGPSQVCYFSFSFVHLSSSFSFKQCIIPMQTKLADNSDDGLIKIRSKKFNVGAQLRHSSGHIFVNRRLEKRSGINTESRQDHSE